jgi:hypothetical protein
VSEGTQLNVGLSGDIVSDEDISGQPRLGGVVPSIPLAGVAGVKLERTKIAVGPFGVDSGDAIADSPLYVGDEHLRDLTERLLSRIGSNGDEGDKDRKVVTLSVIGLLVELIDTLKKTQLNATQRSHGQINFRTVPASLTRQRLASSNPLRQGLILMNDANTASAGNLYILLHDGTQPTSLTSSIYSVQIVPGAYFELPFGWTGHVDCIWDLATGQVNITEVM